MVTWSMIWSDEVEANSTDFFGALTAPYTTTKGTGLTTAGFFVAAGSIPLFIIAGKNKRKAAAVSFKNQLVPPMNNLSVVKRTVPSLNLKIKF